MNLLDITERVREYLDAPDTSYFNRASVTDAINEAYKALYDLVIDANREYGTVEEIGDLLSGAVSIAMPERLRTVYFLGINSDTRNFKPLVWADAANGDTNFPESYTGQPNNFTINLRTRLLNIYPTPTSNYRYKLVYRTKFLVADELSADLDIPSLVPAEYHRWLIYKAVLTLLPKDMALSTGKVIWQLKMTLESQILKELGSSQQSRAELLTGWNEDNYGYLNRRS